MEVSCATILQLGGFILVLLSLVVALRRCLRRPHHALPPHVGAIGGDLRLRRFSEDHKSAGEVLLLLSNMNGKNVFWQIDTGYAGPPVLSTTYLSFLDRSSHGTTESDYHEVLRRLQRKETRERRMHASDTFAYSHRCVAYTSGCTMRLMGIASTVEQQADMFMCGMLEFESVQGGMVAPKLARSPALGGQADVLVTNPLPSSVHILTSDYLFQIAPCCMHMQDERLEYLLSPARVVELRASFAFSRERLQLVGGSLAVPIRVGGRQFRVTVDTGAPGSICLGRRAQGRFTCLQRGGSVHQVGVNAESVCSSIVTADVDFFGHHVESAVVFVNDLDVEHTDGYVGLGFLRGFDLMLAPPHVGFRPSGLSVRRLSEYRADRWLCPAHQAGPLQACPVAP